MLVRRGTALASCPVLLLSAVPRRSFRSTSDTTTNSLSGSAIHVTDDSKRSAAFVFHEMFKESDEFTAKNSTAQQIFQAAREMTLSSSNQFETSWGATSDGRRFPHAGTGEASRETSFTLRTAGMTGEMQLMKEQNGSGASDDRFRYQHLTHHLQSGCFRGDSSTEKTSHLKDAHKTTEEEAMHSYDVNLYASVYGLWEQRSKELMETERDMQKLVSGSQYVREMQQNDIKYGVIDTTRLSLFVVFPFVLLVSIILFNESILYSAELKQLRLVDYDAWHKNYGQLNSSRQCTSKR